MSIGELTIYQRIYDFMGYFFPIVDRFPKHEKFALSTQLKNDVLELARLVIRANKARNKRPMLYDLDVKLEELRMLVRFAHDRKYLSGKSYEHTSRQLAEIGRLLGGWIKRMG